MDLHPRRWAAVAAGAAAAALFSACGTGPGDGATRHRPRDADEIVLALPAGLARLAAESPADAAAAAEEAEALIELAHKSRDARYFGRAEALVGPRVRRADAPPRLLVTAADLAQQRHEFAQARTLLDRALAADPRDAGALVKRANLALLLGEHGAARRDCAAALAAGAAFPATICLAAAMTGPGSAARARRLLAGLDHAAAPSPAVALWLLMTDADLALRVGDAAAARSLLERAHDLAPDSDEVRARLAALEIDGGDAGTALAMLDRPGSNAALLVLRVRAAAGRDAAAAAASRRELAALLEVSRLRGAGRHLREEGELALYVDQDAGRALELARRNFALQKDTPDLRLLVDAALACGDRATLRLARAWLDSTGFEDHVAATRLAGAGA